MKHGKVEFAVHEVEETTDFSERHYDVMVKNWEVKIRPFRVKHCHYHLSVVA